LLLSFAITSVSKTVLDFKKETQFENPVFDYLILAAILLVFFIGYLQFNGTHYGLAT
jgi:hypothetical protein